MKEIFDYIKDEVKCGYDDRKKVLIIKEDDCTSKIKKILISCLKDEAFAFKLDCKETGCISNYIGHKIDGIRSACDGIILLKKSGWTGVIFIEIKSDNFKRVEIDHKFKSSKAFIKYLQSLYNEFNNNPIQINTYKFILFSTKPIGGSNPRRPINIAISDNINAKRYYVPKENGEINLSINELIK